MSSDYYWRNKMDEEERREDLVREAKYRREHKPKPVTPVEVAKDWRENIFGNGRGFGRDEATYNCTDDCFPMIPATVVDYMLVEYAKLAVKEALKALKAEKGGN